MLLYVFETSSTVHVIKAWCIMLYDWVIRCRFVWSIGRYIGRFPRSRIVDVHMEAITICIAAKLNYCESGNLGCKRETYLSQRKQVITVLTKTHCNTLNRKKKNTFFI